MGEGGRRSDQREYGVRLVRGPFVRLDPHPDARRSDAALVAATAHARRQGKLIAADLFCGAGGMSFGLLEAGFQVVVGVDSDREALETHAHHFPGRTLELDLSDPRAIGRTVRLLKRIDVDLIAGGPPCQPFSRAGKSWINELVRRGQRKARDERRTLWRSFTEVVEAVRPRVVLMENVPEMALDRDVGILREIVHILEQAGYSVEAGLVDAWRYGVPQFRQRLIVVALRDLLAFEWPPGATGRVKLGDAISDLRGVEGGWRPEGGADGFVEYDGPRTTFQRRMRRDVPAEQANRIYDHITRPVRADDAEAFRLMDTTTLYSELPAHLKRYRDDVHDDRYKRLDFNDLSRTITAHIAKDGYWYIHPEQHRTLTVREAARIQTFPDHVRFAGPPSTAFRQIGNAVPPALAEHLAHAIRRALEHPKRRQGPSTKDTQAGLTKWIVERSRFGRVGVPWHDLSIASLAKGRRPPMTVRWLAVVAEVLLDRVPVDSMVRDRLWPIVRMHLGKPSSTLQNATLLRQLAHGVRREARVQVLLDAAGAVAERPETLATIDQLASLPGITQAMATVVARLVPGKGEDPIAVTVGLLRVAARYGGTDVDTLNRLSSGRLEIARLIGVEPRSSGKRTTPLTASLAHIALFEIAERVCTVARPVCEQCPLGTQCASRKGFERPPVGQQQLAFA